MTFSKVSSTSSIIMDDEVDLFEAERGICKIMGLIDEHGRLKASSTGYVDKPYSSSIIVIWVL